MTQTKCSSVSSNRRRTGKCSAGFNGISIPVWFGSLCVVTEEWSKSGINHKHFFRSFFFLSISLPSSSIPHSVLCPLFSWPYLFTSPCSIALFLCASPLYPMPNPSLLLLQNSSCLLLNLLFFYLMHHSSSLLILTSFILSKRLCGIGDSWQILPKLK